MGTPSLIRCVEVVKGGLKASSVGVGDWMVSFSALDSCLYARAQSQAKVRIGPLIFRAGTSAGSTV